MAPNLKVCSAKRRHPVTGMPAICETKYSESECPKRSEHVRNMKTGFCTSNWCEGTKARSYSGVPAPTCTFWLVCPCDCHEIVSMMFQAASMERQVVENPEYHPIRLSGVMSLDERAALIASKKTEIREQRAEEVAATDGGDAVHSPSGRTRKGLLDNWVEFVVKLWQLDPKNDCTPVWISETIATCFGVPNPSVGAIDAVLKRWEEVQYAQMAKKPTRFVDFTPEGKRLGLEVLKEKNRILHKTERMAAGRAGVR